MVKTHGRLQASFSTAFIVALAGWLSACVHPEMTPGKKASKISVSVLERATVSTPAADQKIKPAVLEAKFLQVGSGTETESSIFRAFQGLIQIPMMVENEGNALPLRKLTVLDESYKPLANWDEKEIRDWLTHFSFDEVFITVVVTQDGSRAPVSDLYFAHPHDERFVTVKLAFPNPSELVTHPNPPAALAKLKHLATPTAEFHEELLKVVQEAESLDLAHLQMILDACFMTVTRANELEKERQDLNQLKDPGTQERLERIQALLAQGVPFKPYLLKIAEAGLPKTRDLEDYASVKTVLNRIFPHSQSNELLEWVYEKFSPMSAADKLDLLKLAKRQGESQAAQKLALEWFRLDSDRTPNTLLKVASNFQYAAKDQVIQSGIPSIRRMAPSGALALVSASYQNKTQVALAALPRIYSLSVAAAVEISSLLPIQEKDEFLLASVDFVVNLTRENLVDLSSHAYEKKQQIFEKGSRRLTGGN